MAAVIIKTKGFELLIMAAEKVFWAIEPDKRPLERALKTKPRYFGVLQELFVQWCLDFLDNWILNLTLVFLVNWIWFFNWILVSVSDVKVMWQLLL